MAPVRTIICLIVALLGFASATTSAAERVYFIAADEVTWDYAPSYPNNPITGELFTTDESVYLREAKGRIGRRYLKAIYREYTDASFVTLKPQGPKEGSLGILGRSSAPRSATQLPAYSATTPGFRWASTLTGSFTTRCPKGRIT
jgi:hypothetical protein